MAVIEPAAIGSSLVASRGGRGDRIFSRLSHATGLFVFALIAAIAAFLIVKAAPAIKLEGTKFLTVRVFLPDNPGHEFGVAALAFGTALSSVLAMIVAVPVAIGSALFLVELAPRRVGRPIGYLIDLLAAVPSVVYGLWGVFVLVPHLIGVERWLAHHLGFIPLFSNPGNIYGHAVFVAVVVLSVMILPIIVAISREVLVQVPVANREAAMALGATRWEIVRLAVLPYARGGLIGAVMLGLARAASETIAVAMVLSFAFNISFGIITPGGVTIASNIANKFAESANLGREALIATGLVLFVIIMAVNMAGRAIVDRSARKLAAA
jgi:phosphate transport system permease protein